MVLLQDSLTARAKQSSPQHDFRGYSERLLVMAGKVVTATGSIVWDMTAYDFLGPVRETTFSLLKNEDFYVEKDDLILKN